MWNSFSTIWGSYSVVKRIMVYIPIHHTAYTVEFNFEYRFLLDERLIIEMVTGQNLIESITITLDSHSSKRKLNNNEYIAQKFRFFIIFSVSTR